MTLLAAMSWRSKSKVGVASMHTDAAAQEAEDAAAQETLKQTATREDTKEDRRTWMWMSSGPGVRRVNTCGSRWPFSSTAAMPMARVPCLWSCTCSLPSNSGVAGALKAAMILSHDTSPAVQLRAQVSPPVVAECLAIEAQCVRALSQPQAAAMTNHV